MGLVFDGNIHSLGGDYWFDEALNRTVALTTRSILEALEKVYGAAGLARELRRAAGSNAVSEPHAGTMAEPAAGVVTEPPGNMSGHSRARARGTGRDGV